MKENPDINDTLREHGPDAVRARHDRAKKYNSSGAIKTEPERRGVKDYAIRSD